MLALLGSTCDHLTETGGWFWFKTSACVGNFEKQGAQHWSVSSGEGGVMQHRCLMLCVQAAAGPHLGMQQTPRGVVVMWERQRQDELSISTLCKEELRSLYSVGKKEGKMIQGGQGQRCWAMLLCVFIYKCRGKNILFLSACLSHSVQLEFSISVQPACAAPLSLCEPQAHYLSFMLLHVFHIK